MTMPEPAIEQVPVHLIHRDKTVSEAEFIIWDFDPDNPNWIRLGLRFR